MKVEPTFTHLVPPVKAGRGYTPPAEPGITRETFPPPPTGPAPATDDSPTPGVDPDAD